MAAPAPRPGECSHGTRHRLPTGGRRGRLPPGAAAPDAVQAGALDAQDAQDVKETLSFDEVVDALGRRGERSLGLQEIPLDQIVGSVDKVRDFDRRFRPTSDRSRQRWEALAEKSRLGEYLPPIDVYKLGNLYFVRDGHHRVSVARAQGATEIEAYVTEIDTVIDTEGIGGRRDLEGKNWGLRFLKRVPLTGERRAEINCTDPSDYHRLAEMVEAWACRLMHDEGAYFDKATMAKRWFDEEYTPVVEMIDEAGVRGPRRDRSRRLHPGRQGALPADPRARLEPRRAADGRPEDATEKDLADEVSVADYESRNQTAQSVGRPPSASTSPLATSTSPSGSGRISPPRLAITRTGAPDSLRDVEGQHVLAEVDPGQPAAADAVLAAQPQQGPVELERRARHPVLPVHRELAVRRRVAAATSFSVGPKPYDGASPSHGIGTRQPSRPRSAATDLSQVGSCRTSSGSSVASGSPSSSPW